jgi:hypothetical protein
MDAQQLHDHIIEPTLEYMGSNYNTVEARFLLLCTAAIESECGHYIKQVGGPALGIWQMEPDTHSDIWINCDAIHGSGMAALLARLIGSLEVNSYNEKKFKSLISSPMYACAMARLKYSMDSQALPKYNGGTDLDLDMFYRYYKRVYNTKHGKSTFSKWIDAINRNKVLDVQL